MNKNMFPSLIKSLVSPRKKKIIDGLMLSMSTSLHSSGNFSINLMGLVQGDVDFILNAMKATEDTVFIQPKDGINLVRAASEIYKVIPKNTNNAPAFKQVFAYLIEAIESQNVANMKAISKFFIETIFIKDTEENIEAFLLPENIETIEVPSGKKKKYYS